MGLVGTATIADCTRLRNKSQLLRRYIMFTKLYTWLTTSGEDRRWITILQDTDNWARRENTLWNDEVIYKGTYVTYLDCIAISIRDTNHTLVYTFNKPDYAGLRAKACTKIDQKLG